MLPARWVARAPAPGFREYARWCADIFEKARDKFIRSRSADSSFCGHFWCGLDLNDMGAQSALADSLIGQRNKALRQLGHQIALFSSYLHPHLQFAFSVDLPAFRDLFSINCLAHSCRTA